MCNEGLDVLPFIGVASLVKNLHKLFESRKNDNLVCLVQELVPGVVGEFRVLCFSDKHSKRVVKEPVWMISAPPVGAWDVRDFKLASTQVCQLHEAPRRLFKGDAQACLRAEREALDIVDRWLLWYKSESPEPPQCTRVDFLVTHPEFGDSAVWTVEVGECGASLCSVEVQGRNIAAVNNAIGSTEDPRFPQSQPDKMSRNSGWKS